MYFDLNVPVVAHQGHGAPQQSKKSKGKQPQAAPTAVFTPAQIATIEARVDLLVHLGYTVIAFNQTVEKKIDQKTHVNTLDSLLPQLKRRTGIVFLKRLTINIDEDSEKGFGLTSANASLVESYDIIALAPTTATTFSVACLTHSSPSPLTAHIITLPLTLPRLPFHLKHTLVRTAIKNGAVFEINYAGALGDSESSPSNLGVTDTGMTAKRNWWAAAREVVRVTKGKGIIVSGGVIGEGDYRGPKDVQNLIALLGLAQNLAHDASTVTPKSLVLRAQTRKTYRAVLSEPRIVIPPSSEALPAHPSATVVEGDRPSAVPAPSLAVTVPPALLTQVSASEASKSQENQPSGKKRPREPEADVVGSAAPTGGRVELSTGNGTIEGAPSRKKKKKGKGGLGHK